MLFPVSLSSSMVCTFSTWNLAENMVGTADGTVTVVVEVHVFYAHIITKYWYQVHTFMYIL